MRSSASWFIVPLISVLLVANAAEAQDPITPSTTDCTEIPECVEMVKIARGLSDAKQLNAALQTYQSAYTRWQSPWLLINIGRIQQKLGRPTEAIASYHRYLDSPNQDALERADSARDFLKQAEQDLVAQRAKEVAAANHRPEKPIHKKWWFWAAIGGAVVVTVGVAVGVTVGVQSSAGADREVPGNTGVFTF